MSIVPETTLPARFMAEGDGFLCEICNNSLNVGQGIWRRRRCNDEAAAHRHAVKRRAFNTYPTGWLCLPKYPTTVTSRDPRGSGVGDSIEK